MEEETISESEVIRTEAIPNPVEELPSMVEQAQMVSDMVEKLITRLMQPWSACQLLIILGLMLVSWCFAQLYRPRMRRWLGASHGLPK